MRDIWMTCLSIVNNIQRISTLCYKKVVWYLGEGNKNLRVNLMQYVYQVKKMDILLCLILANTIHN